MLSSLPGLIFMWFTQKAGLKKTWTLSVERVQGSETCLLSRHMKVRSSRLFSVCTVYTQTGLEKPCLKQIWILPSSFGLVSTKNHKELRFSTV